MEKWIGKVALVTGASAGIGRAICLSLANAGMRVVGVARNVQAIENLREEVALNSGTILPMKCDVTKMEEIDSVFAAINEKFGGVDVCINNAGLSDGLSLLDGKPEDWRNMSEVNIIALCYCSKLATNSMVEKKSFGHIINISSIVSHVTNVSSPYNFYTGTKYAVKFLTEGLRQEMIERKHNIRVTAISPGAVETEFFQRAFGDESEFIPSIFLKPEDISKLVVYILSAPQEVEVNDVIIKAKD